MELDFWIERWDNGRIGFHQDKLNPYLAYFYGEKGPTLSLREKLKIFVPLCGKSKDMLWLSQNGYSVFAVECSKTAVVDFFEENALNYKHVEKDQIALFQTTDQNSLIEIVQGDFFAIEKKDLAGVTDIFDRASLIALPENIRSRYVDKMTELQDSGIRTLLVTLTYDPTEMNGPPFSLLEKDVHDLYSEHFSIEKLCTKDVLSEETGLKNRGLTALTETVYKLIRQ
ncbi:MAG: thiopurine S-methyltransferase [Gammaproteobacteria bacterium]|nr:MAG: thiopurine S-methyltransferase [Gammaproteobacteria bacterium]